MKAELDSIRGKSSQLSGALSSHQERLSATTKELFTAKDKLSRVEVSYQALRSSYQLLEAGERQARQQYESLAKEQRGHAELMINLQSIQNNLDKSEFENKTRLGAQIQGLERELSLAKDRLHTEESRRDKMENAFETEVSCPGPRAFPPTASGHPWL